MTGKMIVAALLAGTAAPAGAQDTAEKIGIAAALGLTAGTGKTTLSENAGSIEAALLNTDAMDQAGRIIAAVVNAQTRSDVLVVSREESVDLLTASTVRRRLAALTRKLENLPDSLCVAKATVSKTVTTAAEGFAADDKQSATVKTEFQISDITAALATETNIATVKVAVEDRDLVQAVVMNGSAERIGFAPEWTWTAAPKIGSREGRYTIPSEVTALKVGSPGSMSTSPALNAYEKLLDAADAKRHCSRDEAKALVGAADAYATSINTVSQKDGASALGKAIQADAFGADVPLILRVAAEEAGGTSIVNANIWYTLGFPGAATIGSGLIASFRLVDPTSGRTRIAGVVRCATRQMSVKRMQAMVQEDKTGRRTICAYRTTGGVTSPGAETRTGD